jgi:hypothetical protein
MMIWHGLETMGTEIAMLGAWITRWALSAGVLMIGYQALMRTMFCDYEHVPLAAMKRMVIGCAVVAEWGLLLRCGGSGVVSVWWPITAP